LKCRGVTTSQLLSAPSFDLAGQQRDTGYPMVDDSTATRGTALQQQARGRDCGVEFKGRQIVAAL